jgi:hypothetical protein
MPVNSAVITLPGGAWSGETRIRMLTLRPLCGLDQLFWLEQPERDPLPRRVHGLLGRCIVAAGDPPHPLEASPDWVSALTIGDREALLLHLRRISIGSRIECVLTCPKCVEKLDLDLEAEDLLLPPYASPQREYTASLSGCQVRFRLPTGADQAAIADLARLDLDAAVQGLVQRCVLAVTSQGQPAKLSNEAVEALACRMAELDPQAELDIQMTCPACQTSFSTILDMAQFLGSELASRSRPLDYEIHTLALAYHWSEAEILGLPLRRRRTYLQLLDETGAGPVLAPRSVPAPQGGLVA